LAVSEAGFSVSAKDLMEIVAMIKPNNDLEDEEPGYSSGLKVVGGAGSNQRL
jgi:hypothetical protein